jgi:tetratricopeptide (TPR) repeat protein
MKRLGFIIPILAVVLVPLLVGCSGTVDSPPGESIDSLIHSATAHFHAMPPRYDLAIRDYTKAIEIQPKSRAQHQEALTMRAYSYEWLDKRELATQDWDKLIDLLPIAGNYKSRGDNYLHLGYNERALKDFNKAVELTDDDDLWAGNAYLLRSHAYEALSQPDRAAADAAEACRLGVGGKWSSDWLAEKVGFKCAD